MFNTNTGTVARKFTPSQLMQKVADAHFGGDKGLMREAFGRWDDSGGRFMNASNFVLPKETVDEAMEKTSTIMGSKSRVKPVRRKYASTRPPEGA
jgi:hypothetical protein